MIPDSLVVTYRLWRRRTAARSREYWIEFQLTLQYVLPDLVIMPCSHQMSCISHRFHLDYVTDEGVPAINKATRNVLFQQLSKMFRSNGCSKTGQLDPIGSGDS